MHVMFDAIGQFTLFDSADLLGWRTRSHRSSGLAIETSQSIHGFSQMPYQRLGTDDVCPPRRESCNCRVQGDYRKIYLDTVGDGENDRKCW